MSNAPIDENNVTGMLGLLNTDGATIVPICVNPLTLGLCVNDGTTGTDYGPDNAPRDENYKPVLMATSSADGVTPVAVYADANGNILIQST